MSIQSRFSRVAQEPDAEIGPHGETALALAAQEGNLKAAELAITAGATVFVIDRTNMTPLLYAASRGDADVIKAIARGGKKGLDYSGHTGTALGIVSRDGNIDAAKALIAGGADINAADDWGTTPLMSAVFAQKKDMAEYLASRGANPNVLRMGEGVLHLGARQGGADIMQLLLSGDAIQHINQQTKNQRQTPLHIAVLTGQHDAAKELLDAGALTNIENAQGMTPVEMAAQQGDAKMIRLLVEKGHADLRVSSGENNFTPLHRAVAEGKLDAVKELVRLGADPELKDAEGRSAYVLAAAKGRLDIVQYFTEDYPQPLPVAAAALYAAIMNEHTDVASYLVRSGRMNINVPTLDGNYALPAAVEKFKIPLVREMLDAGANPLVKQGDLTPRAIALQRGMDDAALLLEQAEKDYVMRQGFPKSGSPSP